MPPRRKKKSVKKKRRSWIIAFLVLLFCAATIAVAAYTFFHGPLPRAAVLAHKPGTGSDSANYKGPITTHPTGSLQKKDTPLVAIIIDDMGYNLNVGNGLVDLDLNLSFAFLPFGPYTEKLAPVAGKKGRDILLHQPMQASDPEWNPGPGTLFVSMSGKVIRSTFGDNLARVSGAVGINNHMGSEFTKDKRAMADLLAEIKKKGIFFVDSLTTPESAGHSLARQQGVPSARRDIFIDNEQDVDKIQAQLYALIKLAEKEGKAIGIGHPYPETLAALSAMQGTLRDRIRLVGASNLAR